MRDSKISLVLNKHAFLCSLKLILCEGFIIETEVSITFLWKVLGGMKSPVFPVIIGSFCIIT